MKYAMNHATLMKTPLEMFLKAIAEAGFHGVELRRDETFNYLQSHSIDDLNQLLQSLNLECISFNAIELFSLCPQQDFQDILNYTERLMKIGIQIGCDLIIAVPSFLDDIHMKNEEIKEKTIARLKILAKMANEYNFRLAFEPLGFPNCSVRKLDFALDIIKNEYLPKMGLVIDTFHFFIAEHNINDLDLLDPEDLWLVHINDAIEKPFNELKDSHRILPCRGFFNLEMFLNKIKELEYDGWVSVELFNEELWKDNPNQVAQKAYKSLNELVQS